VALDLWLGDCAAQGFSPKTIRERRGFIERFGWWLEHEANLSPTLNHLNPATVRRFLAYVRAANPSGRFGRNHPCSRREADPNTVFGYFRELSAFSRFLLDEGLVEENPLANVKRPRVPPYLIEPFSADEVKALIEATRHTPSPLRNRVIVELLADTGLRVSDLVGLTCGSVLQDHLVVTEKGNKQRTVFLGMKVRRNL
jgi:integrase/recombinase XerD